MWSEPGAVKPRGWGSLSEKQGSHKNKERDERDIHKSRKERRKKKKKIAPFIRMEG